MKTSCPPKFYICDLVTRKYKRILSTLAPRQKSYETSSLVGNNDSKVNQTNNIIVDPLKSYPYPMWIEFIKNIQYHKP